MLGKSQHPECEAAGHAASAVRKRREMMAGAQLTLLPSHSPGAQSREVPLTLREYLKVIPWRQGQRHVR